MWPFTKKEKIETPEPRKIYIKEEDQEFFIRLDDTIITLKNQNAGAGLAWHTFWKAAQQRYPELRTGRWRYHHERATTLYFLEFFPQDE